MPRHNRRVTARRSPKPRRRATVAGLPGSSKSKAELFDRLHRAFEAPPQVSETPERARERYIDAIDSVADYLESIGADAVWVDRFDELSRALEDLGEGEFPAILGPAIAEI
jgi:hypothetical protein